MKTLFVLLTLLLLLIVPRSHTLSQSIPNIRRQEPQQQQKPLTLTKLERLIRNPTTNQENALAKDQAIAAEIRLNGITFKPTDFILENLRKLGAGTRTIQALIDLRKRSENLEIQNSGNIYKTTILIANFQGPEIKASNVTDTIIEELKDATRRYDNVEIVHLDEPITRAQGREWAAEKGKEYNADIFLWGWYDVLQQGQVKVSVHFQALRKHLGLIFVSEKQTLDLHLADFFKFEIRLSREMAYLTFFTLGFINLEEGNFSDSIDLFTKAINRSNVPEKMVDPAAAYFFRGGARLMQSSFGMRKVPDQVFEDLEQAAKLHHLASTVYSLKCSAYVTNNELDTALANCKKAIELAPDEPHVYSSRAGIYIEKDDLKSAIADYETAIRLAKSNPDDRTLLLYQGSLASLKGDWDGLISCFSKLIESDIPPFLHFPLILGRGAAYLKKELYELAITEVRRAIELAPQSPLPYRILGEIYFQKGDKPSAISNYKKAIELGLNDARIYHDLGKAYGYNGDVKEAIENFERAIELDPNDAEIYESRGRFYSTREEYGKAQKDYDKSIELNSKRGFSFLYRGFDYFRQEKFVEAFSDYNKAIELMPEFAEAYYFRGVAYKANKDFQRAIDDFKLAIKFDPSFAVAYHDLGFLYFLRGEVDQSIEILSQVIIINPKYVDAYLLRSTVYMVKKDNKKAIFDLTKVVQLTSDPLMRKLAERLLASLRAEQVVPKKN
ncbi:MAG TPA: tetratricopeptide repeat protein [Pyrinomonadaceae bacterium]|jgi:tetratricopeptide (TPR) repeat protein